MLSGHGAFRVIGMAELQGYMVQGYMQWTSMEPSGGVMNRLRCGRTSTKLVDKTFSEYFDMDLGDAISLDDIAPGKPLTYPESAVG
jgi:hypothetical protein